MHNTNKLACNETFFNTPHLLIDYVSLKHFRYSETQGKYPIFRVSNPLILWNFRSLQ